jgi:tetratricopeptide (TPR) repeat protein
MRHFGRVARQLCLTVLTLSFPAFAFAQSQDTNDLQEVALDGMTAEQRGDVLMAQHAYVEAAYVYSLGPMNAVLWNKTGIAYHHLLAIGEARSDYQKALSLQPDYADAMNNLGATYYAERNYKKAIRLYRQALELTPQSAVIRVNLGTAYFAARKRREGAVEYRAAFAEDPSVFDMNAPEMIRAPTATQDRANLEFCLAELFAEAGDRDQALSYLEQAFLNGSADRKRVMEDPAFAALRTQPEFAALVARER